MEFNLMAASDNPNWDPGISWGQRQDLFRRTGDRYWLEDRATKEQAGKQYALIKGKKKMETNASGDALIMPADDPKSVGRAEESMGKQPRFSELGPKEKSAFLQEESFECSKGLLALRNHLKSDIIDEMDASDNYTGRINEIIGLKLPIWEITINHIANDEAEHREILQIIVDVITEKCKPELKNEQAMIQMQLRFPPRGGRING
jgi:hypothetical protein